MSDRNQRCSRCHMEDDAYALDAVLVGTLQSGTQVFDWKHKTVDACLFAIGLAVSAMRERELDGLT